ncbi:Flavin-dependent oxidoreductase, luciferase family (includes alkanesulfonate monooxygenase SsuD and methylene tetrahydromethanopterin reductase) [Arthrobacter alpinus]|uniref:Flavin-dependent oxidoreductase, luciferase family (Includes alkanesulfonate monooxygenase SsuD and methylene tetrahydromethanopterin reductase) n=1 Tax=Arthrobacter alpinus TaxID=656366 RepID=A0A1H5KBD1_9MICC|nr:LLM class flavin-dependent oxidoreductase [Arthrobacter alpinus]SEE62089.1 Flavin-dependent oxidoreductase, luciferase family (includes alkanesulfonate monooxygenase SsuD and methylene tetrahydromethanopterin reductase) [Arthrobacter alpinus]
MSPNHPLHLAVALEGAGWHPSAWREPNARPGELFTAKYWADQILTAEDAGIDFVTIDDSLALQSGDPFNADTSPYEIRGRLDAVLIASTVAPLTQSIGLIPTVTTTHTEPFHVSKAVATLDYISGGRAGWQARVSIRDDEAAHFGRREAPGISSVVRSQTGTVLTAAAEALFVEAEEVVEVVRRLWDSWEDDAEIRDVATDRFVDAGKVHAIDYKGVNFSVRGPAITPRPPQGQPLVTALAHATVPYRFAAASADLVFTTPHDSAGDAKEILAEIRNAEDFVGRQGEPLRVYADLLVVLDSEHEAASDRLARLNAAGPDLVTDARIVAGSAEQLAREISALHALGYDGVRLRPATVPDDLRLIADVLVPELRDKGLTADGRDGGPLRARLGLPSTVPNRYAATH